MLFTLTSRFSRLAACDAPIRCKRRDARAANGEPLRGGSISDLMRRSSDTAGSRASPLATRDSLDRSSLTIMDIRTLTAEKQPRSANEMVALVAYYLSELAPEAERSTTVNPDTIRGHFKMAGVPLPRVLRSVLPNATVAGYLENVSRGEYRLNPVSYNLVVHGLPRSSGPGPAGPSGRPIRRGAGKKTRQPSQRGR